MKRLCSLCILFLGSLAGLTIFQPGAGTFAQAEATGGDAVARLQQRMERGEVQLEYAGPGGWLQSVLRQLRVPVSSQTLVFSKTSLQSVHISPANPRAIYFNDEVYVGWIRGAELLEVSAVDPKLGAIFYTLTQQPAARPAFVRNDTCMRCHGSASTRFIPGHLVRSVFAEPGGTLNPEMGSYVTDHTSRFRERWGGWYVTGTHGEERHLGNMFFSGDADPDNPAGLTGGNLTSLDKRVDLRGYASPHSDIVALMVLAHQTQMQNLIVRLGYETQMALREEAEAGRAKGSPGERLPRRIQIAADELLRYMLFADEAGFSSPIAGTAGFAAEFAAAGPRDSRGRSLRDFDLERRLFRYPCSYLILSEAFDQIPQPALDYLYQRLWLVLTGQAQEKEFAAIPAADRRAVLEILCETKKNLPAYFRAALTKS
ncbi:MAG TPA: hypothetical protein VNQ79_23470 [Blastocatellia bacterium]|nr:hypothetical protein [Blastocatellia bacterium]